MPSQPSHQPDGAPQAEPTNGAFPTRSFRLPADPAHLERGREYVDDAAAEFGMSSAARYQLVFAVNEALTNAVKHGSPDADGNIGLHIDAQDDTLICSVVDKGPFVAAPADSDALADSGRGLTFMTLLMDEVELSSDSAGTIIRLHKRRAARAA